MTTPAKGIAKTDVHAVLGPASFSNATVSSLKAFVAQSRSTTVPIAAKTLLVVGGEASCAQAAAAVAAELQRDVMRVPLSAVVSKYIGETEKNLDLVFAKAAKSNVVLFFDEGDALFGERSDVKDSHDRYANAVAAYLLKKIESHAGVAILATRHKPDLDEAFTRRLGSIVHVDPPH